MKHALFLLGLSLFGMAYYGLMMRSAVRKDVRWGDMGEGPRLSMVSHVVALILILMFAALAISDWLDYGVAIPIHYLIIGFFLLLLCSIFDHTMQWWRTRKKKADAETSDADARETPRDAGSNGGS